MRNRLYSYLNTATNILQAYKGLQPFSAFIKDFFKQHKKYGSKDRKLIADLCYCYFRLGSAFSNLPADQKLLRGQLLCNTAPNVFIQNLKPEWTAALPLPVSRKWELLSAEAEITKVFPFAAGLSDGVDKAAFTTSLLQQPLLFLRVRPGYGQKVKNKLIAAAITYEQLSADTLALANSSKLDEVLLIDRDAVIQDLSSQQVLYALQAALPAGGPLSAWDCCAASGGKSILLKDTYPQARLTVSDVRESILINLRKRFDRAAINLHQAFVADISTEQFSLKESFDIIICDVPCSGSGTWGRTPEWLCYFKEEKISDYAALQKRIAANAAKHLKKGGYLVYITCSVFGEENEAVTDWLQEHTALQLVSREYCKGYHQRADTLFTALFRK